MRTPFIGFSAVSIIIKRPAPTLSLPTLSLLVLCLLSPTSPAQSFASDEIKWLYERLEDHVEHYRLSSRAGKSQDYAIADFEALKQAGASEATLDQAAALIRSGFRRWVQIRLDEGNNWAALVRIDNALKAWPDNPQLRELRKRVSREHSKTRGESSPMIRREIQPPGEAAKRQQVDGALQARLAPLVADLAQNISAFRLSHRSGKHNALASLARLREAGAPAALLSKAENSLATAYQDWILEPETTGKRLATLSRLKYALSVMPDNVRLRSLAAQLREGVDLAKADTPALAETAAQQAAVPKVTNETAQAHEWTDPVAGIPFTYVPGNTFTMGSSQIGTEDDAKPEYHVQVSEFWLAVHETTIKEYKTWVDAGGSKPGHWAAQLAAQANTPQALPVNYVRWEQAMGFASWLSQSSEGNHYRLPTEAEWELACNGGGEKRRFSSVQTREFAWFIENSGKQLHPVAQLKPNTLGLFDMNGNLAEWTIESYDETIYQQRKAKQVVIDPRLVKLTDGSYKSTRGGSWRDYSRYVRCSARGVQHPRQQIKTLGFRLLRESR